LLQIHPTLQKGGAMSIRPVKSIVTSQPTVEGAGVKLNRAFGFGNTSEFDPFLLLDDFRSDRPDDYRAGFPWHPHRGIETITYVLAGNVEHGDSLGNRGNLGAGDVQWMTAGRGIMHQEMPHGGDAFDRAAPPPEVAAHDPHAGAVVIGDLRNFGGLDVLVARRRHFQRRRQIGPELETVHAALGVRAISTSGCRRASVKR
jgi:hypothetical protein